MFSATKVIYLRLPKNNTFISDCPCGENCPDGCDGCDSAFCHQTTSSTTQTTTAPTKNAILVLSTYADTNRPLVIDFNGNVNDNVDFHYESGTKVEFGCGATLMDQFYYFGGPDSKRRQV